MINRWVYATANHVMMSSLDAFLDYNKILMHLDDQEKKFFISEKGIYCYKIMSFRLKNVKGTYQWLVNWMFKDQIGKTMEFYIDDMLVNLEKAEDHLVHLRQTFNILENSSFT